MAVKPIVTIPNPVLTTKTENVVEITNEIRTLAKDLLDTLDHAKEPEGAGLAATQLGSNKRMCVVRQFFQTSSVSNKISHRDLILINPKIVSKSTDTDIEWEGCLSVPDTYGKVIRFKKIKVRAQTLEGDDIQITATDFLARVMQHEIDHLDGVLFTSRIVGKALSEKELDKVLQEEE